MEYLYVLVVTFTWVTDLNTSWLVRSPECCWSQRTRLSAGALRRSTPATKWRSQSSEDWLHRGAPRRSEPVPGTRPLTEGSPAEETARRKEKRFEHRTPYFRTLVYHYRVCVAAKELRWTPEIDPHKRKASLVLSFSLKSGKIWNETKKGHDPSSASRPPTL